MAEQASLQQSRHPRQTPNVDVVIYEKLDIPGGSTILSGGNIGAMGTDNLLAFAEETGMDIYKDDTFEMYYEDKLAAGCYYSDPELARVFCYDPLDNFNWLRSLGITWNGSRFYENAVDMPSDFSKAAIHQACQYLMAYDDEGKSTMVNRKFRYNIGSTYGDLKGGPANFQCLLDTLSTHPNASLVTGAPVKSIIRSGQISGEVQGVVLENGKRVRAKKAVILTAGGFAGNGKMLDMYDPRIDPSTLTSGGTGNTGEMLVAAELVGGQTVNMQCIQIDFGYTAKEPTLINTANSNPFGGAGDYIEVGPDGKRFWAERRNHEQFMDAELMCTHRLGYKNWWEIGDSQSISEKTTEGHFSVNINSGEVDGGQGDGPGVPCPQDVLLRLKGPSPCVRYRVPLVCSAASSLYPGSPRPAGWGPVFSVSFGTPGAGHIVYAGKQHLGYWLLRICEGLLIIGSAVQGAFCPMRLNRSLKCLLYGL